MFSGLCFYSPFYNTSIKSLCIFFSFSSAHLFSINSVIYTDRKNIKCGRRNNYIRSYPKTPSHEKEGKTNIVKPSSAEDIQSCYLQFSCLLSSAELDQYLNKYLAFNFSRFKY